ncbi:MAG: protein kinase [Polyangiaceae bacterium]|nr:protein kinase [Polyangiaceae bacterium]
MASSVDNARARALASSPLKIGSVLGSIVRIERIVGVGGMAYVYEARRTSDGSRVAVKCMLPALSHDAVDVTRFLREAEATSRLRSPHVARIFETSSGVADGVPPYFVMEYLEGQDLGAELAANGPLSVASAVDAVLQACAGVVEAHALGIVHRDLKPSNLFRCGRTIKVVDFGIAKSLEPGGGTLTETSDTFGSPRYMSPEQVRSTKSVDARTDVWSMGVVLYELLSGTVPFDGETAGAVLAAIVADEPPSLRARAPRVPAALEAIVNRCLAKDREHRVQSVQELAALLRNLPAERRSGGRFRLALAFGLPLALATGVGGYVVALRYASMKPRPTATATTPNSDPSATVSAAPSDAPVPDDTLSRPDEKASGRAKRPGAPASASAPRFKPCTSNEQCGPFEKCYPGGCSCKSPAVRCGEVCRMPGVDRTDCGCGQVCGADEVCSQHGNMPSCDHCEPEHASCGGTGCIDLRYSSSHCGVCGHACAAGSECFEGKCVPRVQLGGSCSAFRVCAWNMRCEGDRCECIPGLHPCNGVCTVSACATP